MAAPTIDEWNPKDGIMPSDNDKKDETLSQDVMLS